MRRFRVRSAAAIGLVALCAGSAAPRQVRGEEETGFRPPALGVLLLGGYGFRLGGQNVDTDANGDAVYLNSGEGLHGSVELFTGLTRHFDLGIQFGDWSGSTSVSVPSRSTTTTDTRGTPPTPKLYQWVYTGYSNKWTYSIIPIRLDLRANLPITSRWKLFAGALAGIYLPSDIVNTGSEQQQYSYSYGGVNQFTRTASDSWTITTSLQPAFGYGAIAGVEFDLTPNFGIVAQAEVDQVTFAQKQVTNNQTRTGNSTVGSGSFGYTYSHLETTTYSATAPVNSSCTYDKSTVGMTITYTTACSTSSSTDAYTSNGTAFQDTYSENFQGSNQSTPVYRNADDFGAQLGLILRF